MRRGEEAPRKYRLLYDLKLMRPGCVLLQAMAGGTVDGLKLQCIGEWLVSPTPDMKMYEITEEQLDQLVEIHMGKELVDRLSAVQRRKA